MRVLEARQASRGRIVLKCTMRPLTYGHAIHHALQAILVLPSLF